MGNIKFGFMSSEHATNYQAKVVRSRNKKQPVKIYTGEELAKMAAVRGCNVSTNHTPPQASATIDISALPEHLRKLVK